jgi:hypothetical protein
MPRLAIPCLRLSLPPAKHTHGPKRRCFRPAPTGKLRAAISFGNPILAAKMRPPARRAACRSISRANWRGASTFRLNW